MPGYRSDYIALELHATGSSHPHFNVSSFMAEATFELAEEMHYEAKRVVSLFNDTVQTWRTDVDFYVETDRVGDTFSVTVFTDSDIYRFVNDGTSVRYAVMTEDFIPKTYPGIVSSTEGRGGFSYIPKDWKTRKIPGVYPKPGIKARNFVDAIYNKREQIFYSNMETTYSRVIARHWEQAFSA